MARLFRANCLVGPYVREFSTQTLVVMEKYMNKADLVEKLAEKSGLTKAASEKLLNAFLESVTEILLAEGRLSLAGFGTFVVECRQERNGRNPRTGDVIKIPAAKVVKFRPGKKLKDTVQ